VDDVSKYSTACNIVNITPKNTVTNKPNNVLYLSPDIIAWCDQVIVAPDVNKIAVFNKGTSNAFNGTIPTGGQTAPISGVGPNELWKNAQKMKRRNKLLIEWIITFLILILSVLLMYGVLDMLLLL